MFIRGGAGRVDALTFAAIEAIVSPLCVAFSADGEHFGFNVGSNAVPRSADAWRAEIVERLTAASLWPVPTLPLPQM